MKYIIHFSNSRSNSIRNEPKKEELNDTKNNNVDEIKNDFRIFFYPQKNVGRI